MTDAESSTLVFKDQAGEYYLLPQTTLEQGRVPAEQKAEVERVLAESHDVSGHLGFLAGVFVGAILGGGAAVGTLVYELRKGEEEVLVPDIQFPT